jgi:hypothetical protein
MSVPVDHAKSKVREWVQKHSHAVLYDEDSSALQDVSSGKNVLPSWRDLAAFEEKVHPETGDTYLVLLFDSGMQIALVDPGGIGFAPSEVNTGPLQGAPSVVCLRDLYTLKAQIEHYLFEHIDEPLPRECLDMVMMGIAILDGARAVGFEVGELEAELERSLREIERRTN